MVHHRFYPNTHSLPSHANEPYPEPWSDSKIRTTAKRLYQRCIVAMETPEKLAEGDDTLYSGSFGTRVFLRWKYAQMLQNKYADDKASAKEAQEMIQEALRIAGETSLRHYPSHPLRRVALLTGAYVGSTALHVALLMYTGQEQQAIDQANSLVLHIQDGCMGLQPAECDVLYGRAGALQALLFVREHLLDPSFGTNVALQLSKEILDEGIAYASNRENAYLRMPLLWEWHHTKYLGAAHGVIGILSTLLALSESEIKTLNTSHNMMALIRQTITKLDEHCFPSGNLDSSIQHQSHGRSDKLVHWCHGAPGHLLLLVRAYEILSIDHSNNSSSAIDFNNPQYAEDFVNQQFAATLLQRAHEIADRVIWPRGILRKGVGLCHGISGNAYTLLELGKHDPQYIPKAYVFLEFAMENLKELEHVPDEPYSLFEGLAALACLVIDMMEPNNAKFPLYF